MSFHFSSFSGEFAQPSSSFNRCCSVIPRIIPLLHLPFPLLLPSKLYSREMNIHGFKVVSTLSCPVSPTAFLEDWIANQ